LEAFAGEVLGEGMNRPAQMVNGKWYRWGLVEQVLAGVGSLVRGLAYPLDSLAALALIVLWLQLSGAHRAER
jgi:hypothetical protein